MLWISPEGRESRGKRRSEARWLRIIIIRSKVDYHMIIMRIKKVIMVISICECYHVDIDDENVVKIVKTVMIMMRTE